MNIAAFIASILVILIGAVGIGVLSKGVHEVRDAPNKDKVTLNFVVFYIFAFAIFFGGIGGAAYTVKN